SGWQPRWFLLCGGILSYYDSKEDAWKGCKGSIQMAVCEIQVHPTDCTRMDLAIPGEQYFYLKARTAAERQQWLVALGSAKACITDVRTKKEKEFSENTDVLKRKMSELRLYCDILVQQVTKTKETSDIISASDSQENIDMGALLKSTCNTFLKTLEECMQIANTTFTPHLVHATPPGSPHLSVLKPSKVRRSTLPGHISAQRKMELNNNLENGSLKEERNHKDQSIIEHARVLGMEISNTDPVHLLHNEEDKHLNGDRDALDSFPQHPDSIGASNSLDGGTHRQTESQSVPNTLQEADTGGGDEGGGDENDDEGVDDMTQTFFNVLTHRFNDITLEDNDGIPTEYFLDSCYAIVPVLDKLGSTVFAPVKMDFVGNIKKINQKYITNKEEFRTLQKIVLYEVNASVAQVRNSATEALLWLKRGLKFLYEFLSELRNGENNIQTALSNAYGRTLRQYHGWVVRGVFALALRAAPSYDGFVTALTVKEGTKGSFFDAMQRDLSIYLPAMENQLRLLDTLYEEHGLESDEVV
ncbi:pleckstrin homology domain-containing family A member 8, partial [Pelodytes ibericus]